MTGSKLKGPTRIVYRGSGVGQNPTQSNHKRRNSLNQRRKDGSVSVASSVKIAESANVSNANIDSGAQEVDSAIMDFGHFVGLK